jgi:hypothetical protein
MLGTDFGEIEALVLTGTIQYVCNAMDMLRLDSELMDLSDDIVEEAGFLLPREFITLDYFENNDECEDKTRFTKESIQLLIDALELNGEEVQVDYYDDGSGRRPHYYKFNVQELCIYKLRKMSTASTHKQLADCEFGGCARRWGVGYNWIVKHFDTKFHSLIGPAALRIWVKKIQVSALRS